MRILLYGPVGAGKSSFVNSVSTAVRGRSAIIAGQNATTDNVKSFTVKVRSGTTKCHIQFSHTFIQIKNVNQTAWLLEMAFNK